MCHLSMKLSDTFDQNPPCIFDKIREKTHSKGKRSHGLTLRAKVKVIAKIKRQCPREQKTCLPNKILSRDSPNYWCPTDLSNML